MFSYKDNNLNRNADDLLLNRWQEYRLVGFFYGNKVQMAPPAVWIFVPLQLVKDAR